MTEPISAARYTISSWTELLLIGGMFAMYFILYMGLHKAFPKWGAMKLKLVSALGMIVIGAVICLVIL